MKIADTLMGFAKYELKEYPFIFENGILQLLPSSQDNWKQEQRNLLKTLIQEKWEPSEEWIGYSFIEAKTIKGKPVAIISKSIKGKGVSFMTNNVAWHGAAPNQEQYEIAMGEIDKAIAELEVE